MTEVLIAGIVLGFMGSLHCAVMCGPIALALPMGRSGKYLTHLVHQSGRVTTYAILGAVAGSLGGGLSLAGWQQPLSIGVGVLLLIGLIGKWPTLLKWAPYRKFYSTLQAKFVQKLRGGKLYHFFITGLINGLLPCGLVYAALLGAIGTGSGLYGALIMIGFGLGTKPMLLAIGWSSASIVPKLKGKVRLAIPAVVSIMAIFFILRGMGLSIPYVSPSDDALRVEQGQETAPSCH